MTKQNCNTCIFYWRDLSVGARDCTCEEDFTEREMVDFVENMKDGCPHYIEGEPIEKVEYNF